MALDDKTVRKIARLARIEVTEPEVAHYAKELNHILGWIEQLNEVDTKEVAPMTRVVDVKLPRRPDIVTDGDKQADILANAPATAAGYFVVPKVVE
ncbi:MAG: Asp-tRNA(Asn)/Glu-tRNA(Gln) amidotransferase subunit GatC [Alphaproteobacteria bacterium]|nr:Asp-tRNA(Asn)/Glu-tRNA(Gln) amidotransferase subunit GatC [Alphaproteobacteria bacterium]